MAGFIAASRFLTWRLDAVTVNGSSRITQHGGSPQAKMPNGCLEIPWSSRDRLDKRGFLMDVRKGVVFSDPSQIL